MWKENLELALEQTDGKGLVKFWWTKLEGEELLMALAVARLIWLRRNDVVFGRAFSAPHNPVTTKKNVVFATWLQ
jgi:hypothetical protein